MEETKIDFAIEGGKYLKIETVLDVDGNMATVRYVDGSISCGRILRGEEYEAFLWRAADARASEQRHASPEYNHKEDDHNISSLFRDDQWPEEERR